MALLTVWKTLWEAVSDRVSASVAAVSLSFGCISLKD